MRGVLFMLPLNTVHATIADIKQYEVKLWIDNLAGADGQL